MVENLHGLYASFTEYIRHAAADLESLKGPLPPDEQPTYGVRLLDFDSFCSFWHRVCLDAALRRRWLQRLKLGFAQEKTRIARMVDELLETDGVHHKDAA